MTPLIRPPAFAGTFYPDHPLELQNTLNSLLQTVTDLTIPTPIAMIAPHAGYIYSGPIAATVYAQLNKVRHKIHTVLLLGPSHRVAVTGLAATQMDYFLTPLGKVPVDQTGLRTLLELPQVSIQEQAHTLEHSLEVQLPFLQTVLDQFQIIPLVVGTATPPQIAEVLQQLGTQSNTLILISSDLSHYLDYSTAQRLDRLTSKHIEQGDSQNLQAEHACGHIPIKGLLYFARSHRLKATTLDLRNSGDTAGPKHQVVGYGAYVFH